MWRPSFCQASLCALALSISATAVTGDDASRRPDDPELLAEFQRLHDEREAREAAVREQLRRENEERAEREAAAEQERAEREAAGERAQAEEEAKRRRLLNYQLAAYESPPGDRGARLKPLFVKDVLAAGERLRQRAALPPAQRSAALSYDAIANQTNLNRGRVKQIEGLQQLGWTLTSSHPNERLHDRNAVSALRANRSDLPADSAVVWLPSLDQATKLLDVG